MRLLHTSDWHLGRTFHEFSRANEHRHFLAWLLVTIEDEGPDALIIAGDIFDTPNPSAEAQTMWFQFLAEASHRLPNMVIIAIAGNHDSAERLEAPEPIMRTLRIHVIGSTFSHASFDPDRLLIPIPGKAGDVQAWVAAVPYLRSVDLPVSQDENESWQISGVRELYSQVFQRAREQRRPHQALIALGHCYMVGTTLSEVSERKILGGNQHALPRDIFPDDLSYVALGHLHMPQTIGKIETVRYCGSPIPLAMPERHYPHQVLRVDFEGANVSSIVPLLVPRTVELKQVPDHGASTLPDVLQELSSLPSLQPDTSNEALPYLEVRVLLDEPMPHLPQQIRSALEGKAVRLVNITAQRTGTGGTLAEVLPEQELKELDPEDVFRRKYARQYGESEPPEDVLATFRDLLSQVLESA